ncbi:Spo0E family sporulation regulatory protein-aspartic acid phosphatase [Clostridium vincentii]|uniref:Spo0E family sporulation regulatory protein-aspartic acid phosphatase n=1 Tax=Clostridium vincentii TaxID=52704 RepID=UPI000D048187|nr:Spo0E family sporulation regulatory protein-aspartic acid phosphatase [Clostridium vincentii]
MSFFCTNCTLHTDIEKYRLMLNDLIIKKNHNLLDKEIIDLSQYLDVLVCKCTLCNKD